MLQPPWCFRKFGGETQLKQNQIALINTVLMKTEALSRARHHFEQIESTGREKNKEIEICCPARSDDRKAKR
jgi:hypothetical protein